VIPLTHPLRAAVSPISGGSGGDLAERAGEHRTERQRDSSASLTSHLRNAVTPSADRDPTHLGVCRWIDGMHARPTATLGFAT